MRSSRGGNLLFVDKPKFQFGDTVQPRAYLRNERGEPLAADTVTLFVTAGDRHWQLEMRRDASQCAEKSGVASQVQMREKQQNGQRRSGRLREQGHGNEQNRCCIEESPTGAQRLAVAEKRAYEE